MYPSSIHQKLRFAKQRLDDLLRLIADNRLGSDVDVRHQLTQEFFFHLVGAMEYVAQLANERRHLGIPAEEVSPWKVAKCIAKISASDPLIPALNALYIQTKGRKLPADPYSGDGLLFRIFNYRNHIVHRSTNPFHFVLSAGPRTYFDLDPRSGSAGTSKHPVADDLATMYRFVEQRCMNALRVI